MSDRLRLLFVLPFTPRLGGRGGGAKVTGQLLAALARRHRVAALFLADREGPPPERELFDLCEVLEGVRRRDPPRGLVPRLGRKLALARGIPSWASELAEPGFAARLEALAADFEPDVVQIEYPVMGQYLAALERCPAPRVLVEHDASLRDLRRWTGPLGALTGALDARAWRRFERRVIGGVQAVVVFTERDRGALEVLRPTVPVARVPLGTEIPAAPLDPAGGSPPGVVFVGNFAHPPNVDAALWLAASLFPPLRAARPGVRLTLVGASPPAELRALAGDGVEVTGEVPDVTPYLDDAAVIAAPIRVGGGMRVKVLEALAAGKAVVATPLAVEGLDVAAGEQLEIGETEEELRDALGRLLGDERRRAELAGRARAWAVENLGWDSSLARYEELYASLLGPRPTGSEGS